MVNDRKRPVREFKSVLKAKVACQRVGKELILFTEQEDSVFTVNEAGTIILQAAAEGASVKDIARALSARYGDTLEVCEQAVSRFIDSLREEGLAG
jgi:hypothetical protein